MTKREYFEKIKELVNDNDAYVAFLDKEIANLDVKAGKAKAKRNEKTAAEGEAIRLHAVDILRDAARPITLVELVGGMGGAYTSAKVVYHIKPLIEDGTIVKEKAKVGERKIMTYAIAE